MASNIDPDGQGHLLIQVPDVLADDPCFWALPALPGTGPEVGMFTLPPVNAKVWVEFEQGDPDYAVWCGCFPGSTADLPALAAAIPAVVNHIVLQTTGQHTLAVSDLPGPAGGIQIRSAAGASVSVSDAGIVLSNGQGASIALTGPRGDLQRGSADRAMRAARSPRTARIGAAAMTEPRTAPPPGGSNRYYGKYRATVVDNVDPDVQARLVLQVPDVLGSTPSSWALPCLPAVGAQMGVFALPPIGATVWAEFEQGNPGFPIWTGGFWGSGSTVPPLALAAPPGSQNILLQTTLQNSVLITDTPGPSGGIVLRSSGAATIIVNDTGIYLSNGAASITLIGNVVAVNGAGLTVA